MKVLAIGAHPDDIEIGCGGTVARLVALGHEVRFLIMTSGEEGALNQPSLADVREREAIIAAGQLGVNDVQFMRFPDGLMNLSKTMKIQMIAHIRSYQPEMIFCHDPGDEHLDHKLCAELTLSAASAAAGPWFPDAGSQLWNVSTILTYEVWSPMARPGLMVPITDTLALKIRALQCHQTQTSGIDYAGAVAGLASYRGVMSKGCEPAEAFTVVKLAANTIF